MTERDGANRRSGERRGASIPGPAPRIRVLVVEDNRLMRDALVQLLAAFPDVDIVACAENASAGTAALREAKPQVVLLDAALANGDSHTFLANLRATAPDAKTVVVDFVPAQQDVHPFIDRGVAGFILNDATAEDVVSAIRSVASGTDLPPPPTPPRAARTPWEGGQTTGGPTTKPGGASVRLTKREREIREMIAAGLGNKEIARRLNIATNTVKSHVHNMLGKLAALTPPDRRKGNRSRRGKSRRSYRFSR